MNNTKRQIKYIVVPEKKAKDIVKKKKEYIKRIKSLSLPSVKLLDYHYDDLFQMLRPMSQIYSNYQRKKTQKKQLKQEAQNRPKDDGIDL